MASKPIRETTRLSSTALVEPKAGGRPLKEVTAFVSRKPKKSARRKSHLSG